MNSGKPLIPDGHSPATPLQNVEMSSGHHPEYSASTANPTRATNAQNTSAVRCSIAGRPMVLAYVKKRMPSWGAKVPPSDHHSCRHAATPRVLGSPEFRCGSRGLALGDLCDTSSGRSSVVAAAASARAAPISRRRSASVRCATSWVRPAMRPCSWAVDAAWASSSWPRSSIAVDSALSARVHSLAMACSAGIARFVASSAVISSRTAPLLVFANCALYGIDDARHVSGLVTGLIPRCIG
jgi:hypothetical protein